MEQSSSFFPTLLRNGTYHVLLCILHIYVNSIELFHVWRTLCNRSTHTRAVFHIKWHLRFMVASKNSHINSLFLNPPTLDHWITNDSQCHKNVCRLFGRKNTLFYLKFLKFTFKVCIFSVVSAIISHWIRSFGQVSIFVKKKCFFDQDVIFMGSNDIFKRIKRQTWNLCSPTKHISA